MAEKAKVYLPDPIATLAILAEDAGLVKLVETDNHPSFEDGMVNLAFFGLPDAVIYGFALASLAYALIQMGFVG